MPSVARTSREQRQCSRFSPEVPVPVAAIPVASEDGAATSDAVPAEAPTPETGAPGAASAASDAPASGSAASDAPHAVSAPDATPTQRLNSTEPWGESADAAVLPDPAPVPKDSRTSANAPEAGSTAAVTAPSATSEAVESVSEPCSQTGWKRLSTGR